MDFLREGYSPDRPTDDPTFEQRFRLIREAEVLALDEAEKFKPTEWAANLFLDLMDDRWRYIETHLTLCAMNTDFFTLADPIRDRFQDGRAKIVEVGGKSWRRLNHWSDDL